MARRRRRSNGGKNGGSICRSMKNREPIRSGVEKKLPHQPEPCSSSNNGSKDDSTNAQQNLSLVDSPLGLSSMMQGIELSPSAQCPKKSVTETHMTARRSAKRNKILSVPRTPRKNFRGRSLNNLNKKKGAEVSQIQSSASPVVKTNENNDDEVVHDSQEADEKLLREPDEILLLYKLLTGEERKPPEKAKDPLRNEYRQLYCIGTLCENLSNIMSSRLSSAQQLRKQRITSLNQLKALSLRLEEMNRANLAMEKYLSFDDTAQRDALEIMNIRYEELCDDIFGADDEFLSMFEKEANAESEDQLLTQPQPSTALTAIAANYIDVCMQSKLTEVGLHYVDKVYEQIKQTNAEIEKYRFLIAQQNSEITNLFSELSSIHEDLGSLAVIVDRVIGVTPNEYSRASVFKTRTA